MPDEVEADAGAPVQELRHGRAIGMGAVGFTLGAFALVGATTRFRGLRPVDLALLLGVALALAGILVLAARRP